MNPLLHSRRDPGDSHHHGSYLMQQNHSYVCNQRFLSSVLLLIVSHHLRCLNCNMYLWLNITTGDWWNIRQCKAQNYVCVCVEERVLVRWREKERSKCNSNTSMPLYLLQQISETPSDILTAGLKYQLCNGYLLITELVSDTKPQQQCIRSSCRWRNSYCHIMVLHNMEGVTMQQWQFRSNQVICCSKHCQYLQHLASSAD